VTRETYNGYTNRDTWLVPLWIDNEEGSYIAKLDWLAGLGRPCEANDAWQIGVALWTGTDRIDWDNVDWVDVARTFEIERLEQIEHATE
jgi:hypothetical protein